MSKVPGARVNTIVARVGIGQAKFVATHDSKIGCSDNSIVSIDQILISTLSNHSLYYV